MLGRISVFICMIFNKMDTENTFEYEEENLSDTNQQDLVCSACGGHLKFDPASNKLKCDACGAEFDIEASDEEVNELDFNKYVEENLGTIETQTLHTVECENCGAHVTFDENVVSDRCPFCGTILVVTNTVAATQIKPGSLLPFGLDKQQSFEAFKKWIKALWFAPNDLSKRMTDIKELQGIYVPYWTYDSDTSTSYSGQRGDYYYTTETYTVMVNGKAETRTRQVRHTRWTSVSGSVHLFFDDVLVLASKSLSAKHANALEPWDLDKLIPYDEKYLSGFRTETYQIDLKDGFDSAKKIMDNRIYSAIRRDIGGDEQRVTSKNTSYSAITFKHILLPVYISAYRYNNKVYQILVNARTGEVQGDRPYSVWKILFFSIFSLAAAYLMAQLLGLFEN